MTPEDFWKTYMHGIRPADFMAVFDVDDPDVCVAEYVRQRPAVFGIVRRRTWQETFAAGEIQHTRDMVRAGLTTHLEETRPEWETVSAVARQTRLESRARIQAAAPPAPVPVETQEEPADNPRVMEIDMDQELALPPVLDGFEEEIDLVEADSDVLEDVEDGLPPETELESEWLGSEPEA